ncbi:hypothetical protein V6N12_024078 [Hibiscus sabdariffa]|uniref:RNase H type-1 domain-containing protein n=1 Tax=Hibiscus sabdariffa TaxID=183260 RepID=A0ABR2FZR7_9ROSI
MVVSWVLSPSCAHECFRLDCVFCSKFSKKFTGVIKHIAREDNVVADLLAKKGIDYLSPLYWFDEMEFLPRD